MTSSSRILLYINNKRREVYGEAALQTLLFYIRQTEGLSGTKLGCGEGGCGACTVLLSHYDQREKRISHRAVNACLVLVASCDGMAVTTIEAVGNRKGGLAPLQEALIQGHGSQCGFCTPGIVMSMFALLRNHASDPSQEGPISKLQVENNFDGNLCRCTGYRPILQSFKEYVVNYDEKQLKTHVSKESSCDEKSSSTFKCCGGNCCSQKMSSTNSSSVSSTISPAPSDSDYLFPAELIEYEKPELNVSNGKWMRPVTLERLQYLKMKTPQAKIIVGNTELGIETKFKHLEIPAYLCISDINELSNISEAEAGVQIGASVTWTQLDLFIQDLVRKRDTIEQEAARKYQLSSLLAIKQQLRLFAGKQIRNVGTVAGNIVTASPISDINPLWIATESVFTMFDCASGKTRSVDAREFFLGYRKVNMSNTEILFHIFVPWNVSILDVTHAFKTSRRKEDDIAIVSAGIRLQLKFLNRNTLDPKDPSSFYKISKARISFGGLAAKTIAYDQVEEVLEGKPFNSDTLRSALVVLRDLSKLKHDVPGGMPEFRQLLATGFLLKAYCLTAKSIDIEMKHNVDHTSLLSHIGMGSALDFNSREEEILSRGICVVPEQTMKAKSDTSGRSIKHMAAKLQVSGEAKYLDDIKAFAGELQAAFVLSTEAHARIKSINYIEAESMPGIHKIVTFQDLKGENKIGQISDEFCFAEDKITTYGQVIAVVTAETLEQAQSAARAVKISYDVLTPIVTIEDAIRADSYAPGIPDHTIIIGNTKDALDVASKENRIVQGEVRIGAQEHWYLEPHGTIAIPDENGEMIILSSTQSPGKTQESVAKVLGEPMHKIVCKVKRIGGGFGGKETRNIFISAAAAVAAQATGRPVRLILDRETDMLLTGTRHAFLAKYIAAFLPSGRITALDVKLYLNMGNSFDLSIPVLDRCLYHLQNCYDIPNASFLGKACLTNTASATAFRGFGGPQGMMIGENIIEHISWATNVPSVEVRDINLIGKRGNSTRTTFGMNVNATPLIACWDKVLDTSTYVKRRKDIDEYNATHDFKKKGIAVVPTMFGISFTFKTLNQASALVHIYHGDGSVLISHGGVEMGQGLHTKVCQIAATELGIPIEKVYISETATDKVPNASPTAASASSDMYGMAVKNACDQLKSNMKPIKESLDADATWEEIIHEAWFQRVALSASGFYKTPRLDQLDLGKPNSKGRPFFYYTNGAAVSEVEIDTLTGEHILLRSDIVMDIGRPLNPAIDIGQIEGGFVQGLGWCTIEEVVRGSENSHVWLKPGKMHTLGPGTYKIPGFTDIPKDFRVELLNTRNVEETIHSSKAVGEPPLFLAASAFFAIRDAIAASRKQFCQKDWFVLDSPATVERIRLLSMDKVSQTLYVEDNPRPSLSL